MKSLYLDHVESGRRVDLGKFHLPKIDTGEWRVDTRPRDSPDSRCICIDAPAAGAGRQLHLIDIKEIIDNECTNA